MNLESLDKSDLERYRKIREKVNSQNKLESILEIDCKKIERYRNLINQIEHIEILH